MKPLHGKPEGLRASTASAPKLMGLKRHAPQGRLFGAIATLSETAENPDAAVDIEQHRT
ncbi:MAG: hypothetical protein ACKOED_08900 [Aestuariivirga sp.]|uniref:hypothetical protein n=1 Tax=Aestuariivirga sp. TaxID=2650926 RepID=UPI0038D02F8B